MRTHRANGFNRYQTPPNVARYSSSDQILVPPDAFVCAPSTRQIAASHKV